MSGTNWMIYGANGYAGQVVLEHALRLGHRPLVAGRRADAIRPLAERHGLRHRVFDLRDAAAASVALHDVGTLLLAAGPFSATSAPALDACLRAGTNYVDLTGEAQVIEATSARGEEAKRAGVVLLCGAGFDVVPSDCLAAALVRALPTATRLTLAIDVVAKPGPGTLKTALEGAAAGGLVRRAGVLTEVPTAHHERRVPFARGERWAMTIPWGDLSSAFFSTGVPDIETYFAAPRPVIRALRRSRSFAFVLRNPRVRGALDRTIDRWVQGGSADARAKGRSSIWGRADDGEGRSVEGTVETMETTTLTAHTAVDIALRAQAGEVSPGFVTPSLALGPDYLEQVPDTRFTVGAVRGPA